MSATFERGYQALKQQIDSPTAAYLQSCVHCGMCAEACLFYTETKDPKYTPIYKLGTVAQSLGTRIYFVGSNRRIIGAEITGHGCRTG
ncbi:MAG: 4Fe-4S dicluster domain-containing protein [Thiotrichaceae bacterium]